MEVEQYLFKQPTTFIISGATQSGKSTFVQNLLINKKKFVNPPPKTTYLFYKIWQPIYTEMAKMGTVTKFIRDIPEKKICMTCYSIIKMMADQLLYLTTWVLKLKNILNYSTNYLLY